jgi:flagellar biosynthesis anti-sigma factor FlgM
MKIDPNRTGLDSLGTVRTDAPDTASSATSTRPGPTRQADQVEFSSGAQLAGAAARAAADAPDIRPDAVERAKALLESGRLGDDPHRLADALIDRALNGD